MMPVLDTIVEFIASSVWEFKRYERTHTASRNGDWKTWK